MTDIMRQQLETRRLIMEQDETTVLLNRCAEIKKFYRIIPELEYKKICGTFVRAAERHQKQRLLKLTENAFARAGKSNQYQRLSDKQKDLMVIFLCENVFSIDNVYDDLKQRKYETDAKQLRKDLAKRQGCLCAYSKEKLDLNITNPNDDYFVEIDHVIAFELVGNRMKFVHALLGEYDDNLQAVLRKCNYTKGAFCSAPQSFLAS